MFLFLLFEEELYVEISDKFFLFFFLVDIFMFVCFECGSLVFLLSEVCFFDYLIRLERVFGCEVLVVL